MNIYSKIFINFYNYYSFDLNLKRIESCNFTSTIQILQVYTISAPFDYFGLVGSRQGVYVAGILTIIVYTFNLLYYNNSRLNFLLIEYESLSDKKKKQNGYLSDFISLASVLGFFGIIAYNIYINYK
jgi:hypothetical protein